MIANFWLRVDRSKNNINTPQKMGLGLLLLAGGFFLIAFDGENSQTESQSEAENSLIGLGLLAGGAVLWSIGNSIED